MKPLPPPSVPGKTEFQRFDNAMRRVLTVSKEELLKREESEQKIREHKRQDRKEKKDFRKALKMLDGE